MPRSAPAIWLLLVVLTAPACERRSTSTPASDNACPGPACSEREVILLHEPQPRRALDVALLLDETALAQGRRATLLASLARLGEELSMHWDAHLALVPIARQGEPLAAAPRLWPPPSTGCERTGEFLQLAGPCSQANFTGGLADQVNCALPIAGGGGGGTSSPGRALDALEGFITAVTSPSGAGFLRPEAPLGVVIITSGDDPSASAERAGPLFDRLVALKQGRNERLLVEAAVAVPAEVCADPMQAGRLAFPRLAAFVTRATNARTSSSCGEGWQLDWRTLTTRITASDPLCLPASLVDRIPATPELDLDCVGEQLETSVSGLREATSQFVPRCTPDGPKPCWDVAPQAGCGDGLLLTLDQGCPALTPLLFRISCASR